MGQQTIPLLFLAVSPSKKPWRLFWPRYFRGRNKRHIYFLSLSLRVSVVNLLSSPSFEALENLY